MNAPQTKSLEIVKRNRKYFAARIANKYDCKIVIDGNSEHLTPGQHVLSVDDISVRTKFGTDLIFKVVSDVDQQIKDSGFCTLKPQQKLRNIDLRRQVRRLCGRWDEGAQAWVFPKMVEDKVEELDYIYNNDFVTIEVEFTEALENVVSVEVLGYQVAGFTQAYDGVRIKTFDEVAILDGGFDTDHEKDRWFVNVAEGTVIRFKVASELLRRHTEPFEDGIVVKELASH